MQWQPDADLVTHRLAAAGRTLLMLPGGPSGRVAAACRALGIERAPDVLPVLSCTPAARAISQMDEAFSWLGLIPQDKYVLRRIVGARCLVSPLTGRHLYSWRRLGKLLGADHKAVIRWHGQGVALIVDALRTRVAA